jgi:hypothetical protein
VARLEGAGSKDAAVCCSQALRSTCRIFYSLNYQVIMCSLFDDDVSMALL